MVGGRYFITLRASKTAPAAATKRSKVRATFCPVWPPDTLRLLWQLACASLTSFPLWCAAAWLKATERFRGHLLRFCRSDEAKRRVYEGYLTLHKDWLSELLEKRQLTDRQDEDRLLLEAIEQELRELRTES